MPKLLLLVLAATLAFAQEPVHFAAKDGWVIYGDLYGKGNHAVLLVHGGRRDKSHWTKQAQIIAQAGFTVLAIDLRGIGLSKEGPPDRRNDIARPLDLLAAIRYLQGNGAKTVSIIGASAGGDLSEEALRTANPGEIDRVIFLAHGAYGPPQSLTKVRKLFIVARGDLGPRDVPRLTRIQAQYDLAPDPKELIVLDGSAHAQFLFETDQAGRLMTEILRFLTAP
ncbi:MAG: alpha/beta fold hydrolase [Acidobacteria bacterium]|nr:alpha/beta fold hydrolase [Acidobacteriota bacterium]